MAPSPTCSEANRDAAEAWRERGLAVLAGSPPLGLEALRQAVRLLSKARGLYPLDGIEQELAETQRRLDIESVKAAQRHTEAPKPPPPPGNKSGPADPTACPHNEMAADCPAVGATEPAAATGNEDLEVSRVLSASDHYTSLSITQSASVVDVKKAYHRLSRVVHPDKNSDCRATQAFQKVQAAFATLRDVAKRAAYDATLRATPGSRAARSGRPTAPATRAPNPKAAEYEAERQRKAAAARASAAEAARKSAEAAIEARQRELEMLARGKAEAERVNLSCQLEELSLAELREMCCCVSVGRTGIKSVLRDRIEAKAVAHGAEGVQRTCAHLANIKEALKLIRRLSIGLHKTPEWMSAPAISTLIQRVINIQTLLPYIVTSHWVEEFLKVARLRLHSLELAEAEASSAAMEARRQSERDRRKSMEAPRQPTFQTSHGQETDRPSPTPPSVPPRSRTSASTHSHPIRPPQSDGHSEQRPNSPHVQPQPGNTRQGGVPGMSKGEPFSQVDPHFQHAPRYQNPTESMPSSEDASGNGEEGLGASRGCTFASAAEVLAASRSRGASQQARDSATMSRSSGHVGGVPDVESRHRSRPSRHSTSASQGSPIRAVHEPQAKRASSSNGTQQAPRVPTLARASRCCADRPDPPRCINLDGDKRFGASPAGGARSTGEQTPGPPDSDPVRSSPVTAAEWLPERSGPGRKRKRGALGKEVHPLKQVSINNFFQR